MTEYELQQLQLSQQMLDKLTESNSKLLDLHETVSENVYATENLEYAMQDISDQITHLSNQLDLTHETIYSIGHYDSVTTVCMILTTALLMFLIGYKVARGE